MKIVNILTIGVSTIIVGGYALVDKQEDNSRVEKTIEDMEFFIKCAKEKHALKMKEHEDNINEKEIRNKKMEHRIEVLKEKASTSKNSKN